MVRHRFTPSLAMLIAWLCLAFLLFPLAALLLHVPWHRTFANWLANGRSPLFTSLGTTFVSMLFVVAFGTPLGWCIARQTSFVWRTAEFLLLIPLLMPPLVVGLLLVYFYGPYGYIGQSLAHTGILATNTTLAVVLAQLYESVPYYVFAAQAAFIQVDHKYERASMSLGVPPLKTFLRITLPLAGPGLSVGFAMAFARAIGAFGAVIIVAYYPHTLPISIWIALQEQGLSAALPLALLLVVVSLPLPLLTFLWRRWQGAHVQL